MLFEDEECRPRCPNGLPLEVTRLGTDRGTSGLLLGNGLGNILDYGLGNILDYGLGNRLDYGLGKRLYQLRQ